MGDHLSLYYNFWLLKDNLMHLRNPFSDPYQFYYWGKRFFNPQIGLFSAIFTLLSPLGDVAAFNSTFILSFMLAGGFTFLWLRKSGLSAISSIIGGIIYSLSPHRLSQMCGHINGFFYFSFPMLLYFAEGMVQSPKRRYPILLGVTLLLMAWTEYHMFYYTVLFLVPYGILLILRFVPSQGDAKVGWHEMVLLITEGTGVGILIATLAFQYGWPFGRYYFTLIPIIAFGFYLFMISLSRLANRLILTDTRETHFQKTMIAFLAPLCLFILFPLKILVPIPQYGHILLTVVFLGMIYNLFRKRSYLLNYRIHQKITRGILIRFFPVIPFGLFAVAIVIFIRRFVFSGSIAERGRSFSEIWLYSPHLANLFKRVEYNSEMMIYMGFVTSALMILGLWFLIKSREKDENSRNIRAQACFWFGTFFFSVLLSLGLTVSHVPIYALLYKFVPYFKYPRVPGRMIFISFGAMAFCVAWTINRISFQEAWVRTVLVLSLAVGILIDYYPPCPVGLCLLDGGKTVYAQIKKKDMPPKTLLELPIWPGDSAWSSIYQYYVTRYRYPMVNGYSPAVSKEYVNKVFYGLYPMDVGEIPEKSLKMIKRLHVKYVAFHANDYPFKISPFPSWFILKKLKKTHVLEEVSHTPFITLFRVRQESLVRNRGSKTTNPVDSPVGVLWEAERGHHSIGNIIMDSNASGGEALVTTGKRRGLLMGVQNRLFPSGLYDGIIRMRKLIKETPDSRPIGVIFIKGLHRKTPLFKREITGGDLEGANYSDIKFSFYIPYAQRIECVVYSYGVIPLSLDYSFISFHRRGEGPATFQAEDLFHQARILPLPSGNGMSVKFSPDIINNRGITGPLHRLMPGYYRATFYLGVDGKVPPGSSVALIQVARGNQREILAERTLKRSDWHTPRKLQSFTLKFSLKRPSIMQFTIDYLGKGILWADYIKVAKFSAP